MKNISKTKKIFIIIFCLNLFVAVCNFLIAEISPRIYPGMDDNLAFLFLFVFIGNIFVFIITAPIGLIYILIYLARKHYAKGS